MTTRLIRIIWCILVPLAVGIAYLILGAGAAAAAGEPVLGTVLLSGVVIAAIGTVRLLWPGCLAYTPEPCPAGEIRRLGWLVIGCAVLAFLAGQSLALWLYTVTGSAGFDESVRIRQDAGPAITLLLTLVAAPAAEEMLFRGLLYPLLRRRAGIIASVLITTGVFGLMHGNIVQFASVLPLAVLLALVYERMRVLRLCVLLHLGYNGAATCCPAAVLAGLAAPVPALLFTAVFLGCSLTLYRKVAKSPSPVVDDNAARRTPAEGKLRAF
ncbi:CPBP family intramembrane glutamic endopeptidase [Streptomyces sp. NRRL F-5053]|uniref:CPBP family intramembrane glutamic endopeptidase n=1 Tax=Streptomyces sp. NRRL F-5053 TaxID=1463854 RepID=UPI00068B26C8|nr:type II CAAX endopeptidase family protein [Streptomyces sp. NRRL F-5053]